MASGRSYGTSVNDALMVGAVLNHTRDDSRERSTRVIRKGSAMSAKDSAAELRPGSHEVELTILVVNVKRPLTTLGEKPF